MARGVYQEAELLASCYRNSMQEAMDHGIRRIAFPSISTGAYRFPISLAAEIAVKSVQEYLQEHPKEIDLVEWVLFTIAHWVSIN